MMFLRGGMMRVSFRQDNFHFRHRDHGCEANEEEKERSENPEGAGKGPDIHPGREEEPPRRGKKIAMQSADDNDEALEPHAGVDAHADEIDDEDVVTAPLEPEELRRKRIAEEHTDPPVPQVG